MSDLDTLLSDMADFAKASGQSTATLSRKLLGDGTRYDKLLEKSVGINLRTLERAKAKLDAMRKEQPSQAA